MNYCSRCCQPDTRPGIVFNEENVCGACLYEDTKKTIDWDAREKRLQEIANEAISKHTDYDCVLGVSGGKDSTYTALYARDKLNLRCLLVNNEPEGITEIGRYNIENLINLGFDVIKIRPNPVKLKHMIKRDFYTNLNPVKITEYALWSSAYIIASKFQIPLIIQGENPALTLGVSGAVPMDDNAMNADKQNTLADGYAQYIDLKTIFPDDMLLYHYNRDNLRGIKAIWLQYYDKNWSPNHNALYSKIHGLKWRENFNPEDIGTYVPYAQLDSDLVQVNQMFKYYKFGFGQCTDYCCYDIREGLLTRDESWDLLEKYDGKCAYKYIQKFCDYIGINQVEMWRTVDKFVNKELFTKELTIVGSQWVKSFQYPR